MTRMYELFGREFKVSKIMQMEQNQQHTMHMSGQ